MPPSATELAFRFGTADMPRSPRCVAAGALSATIDHGAVRFVRFGSVEVVRQLDFPIRDRNWATLEPVVTFERLEESADGFRYERHFEVDDAALLVRLRYEAKGAGTVTARAEFEAQRDFETCRTSFTVLHPPESAFGGPVFATAPDGTTRDVVISEHISPSQPVKNIAGLTFTIDDLSVDVSFDGEVFEMEDQRNWSDASFKTYGRPLSEPRPYVLAAGTSSVQTVSVSIDPSGDVGARSSGDPQSAADVLSTIEIDADPIGTLPGVLLCAEDGWLVSPAQAEVLADIGFDALLLRVTADDADRVMVDAQPALSACGGSLDLEIVLDDGRPFDTQLQTVAAACHTAGVSPNRAIALPRAYLASHQPEGPWPEGPGPDAAVSATRRAFPNALIGSGMLTNFTELNRCRLAELESDYFTHGNSAIVHAADDVSVTQTLGTLPAIFGSARAIHGAKPYRLGLTAIGMRTNPYGATVSANPTQTRLTMAEWDPRARALFGACWAVGALSATGGFDIEAIALAAAIGPFGVISSTGPVARAWYDQNPHAVVYPIFHVLRSVGTRGAAFHELRGLPAGAVGFAYATAGSTIHAVIANPGVADHQLRFPGATMATSLDAATFPAAVSDPDWVGASMAPLAQPEVSLASTSVLFVETARS